LHCVLVDLDVAAGVVRVGQRAGLDPVGRGLRRDDVQEVVADLLAGPGLVVGDGDLPVSGSISVTSLFLWTSIP